MEFQNGDLRDLIRLQQLQADCKISCNERCDRHDKLHNDLEQRMVTLEKHVNAIETESKVAEAKRFVFVGIITAICALIGASIPAIVTMLQK